MVWVVAVEKFSQEELLPDYLIKFFILRDQVPETFAYVVKLLLNNVEIEVEQEYRHYFAIDCVKESVLEAGTGRRGSAQALSQG